MMNEKLIEQKLMVLFEDYQLLSKKVDVLSRDNMSDNIRLNNIETRIRECCSIKDLQDRAVAHQSLEKAVEKLNQLITKMEVLENKNIELSSSLADMKVLKSEVEKFKAYMAMVIGGTLALEFFGIFDKIKSIFN